MYEPTRGPNAASPDDSAVSLARVMVPTDANPFGSVHGGVLLRMVDEAAAVVAHRHARRNAVTASIDRVDFLSPVQIGDLVRCSARLALVGSTSMEIAVEALAENLGTGETVIAVRAHLTFVALDDSGRPAPVPPLALTTDEDKRLNAEALDRRARRLAERRRSE